MNPDYYIYHIFIIIIYKPICIFRSQTRVAEPVYYNNSASTPVAVITPVQHGKQQQHTTRTECLICTNNSTVNSQCQLIPEGDDEGNNLYDMPSSPVYGDSHDMFPNEASGNMDDVEDTEVIIDNYIYKTDADFADVGNTTRIQDGVDDDTTITDNQVYCKCTEDEEAYAKDVNDDVTIMDNALYSQDIEECVTDVKCEDDVTIVDYVVYCHNE